MTNYISETIENLKKLTSILQRIDEIKELNPLDIDFTELDSLKEKTQYIKGGIECSLEEFKEIYNEINNFRNEIEIYENLQKSEKVIQDSGYDFYHEGYFNGTCYITILNKKEPLFKIRVSDHELSENNQLPAGVINKYAISKVSPEYLELFFIDYQNMTEEEKDVLWTNRPMSYFIQKK